MGLCKVNGFVHLARSFFIVKNKDSFHFLTIDCDTFLT